MRKFSPDRGDAVLAIVDVQERLASAMSERGKVIENCLHLIEAARLLGIPLVVTEQYPRGLGPTVEEIQGALPHHHRAEKLSFDCCREESFMDALSSLGRRTVLLTGMETHVCVLQTCLGLLDAGYGVHVVGDAVCSRRGDNHAAALELMRDAGAVITCTETVLFQLLERAGTPEFKAISKRIK